MKGFNKIEERYPEDAWDARQRLITGWDAEAIKAATILVIGVGAIGNEVIKNLALLGFGNVIICDLDKIETSNLTRTVLFSQADIGKAKAPLAAERFCRMNLEPTSVADSFTGDVVYELGDGVFRRADIVLGCLDNAETRTQVNKICMRYDIPYIDAGIGALGYTLQIMNGHNYGCYACYAADYKYEDRFRASCDVTKKKASAEGKMATVQCTSAIVAGMQVQETLKVICNMNPTYGIEIHFQGTANLFNKFNVIIDENCPCHMTEARKNVIETPLSYQSTLRKFLEYTSRKGFTEMTVIDDKLRNFVTKVKCPGCGKTRLIYKPMYKVFSSDFYCKECNSVAAEERFYNDIDEISLIRYSLEETEEEILDMKIEQLGIPAFHVLPVMNTCSGEIAFFELTGDYQTVLPSCYNKKYAL